MNRLTWSGWLIAGLLLLQNAAPGLAASANGNPLEGHLLQDSNSTLYLYHGGLKFTVHLVDMTDQVIDAIPTASSTQWDALFTSDPASIPVAPAPRGGPAGHIEPAPPGQPEPFPGYS